MGSLFFSEGFQPTVALGVERAPSAQELESLMRSIPHQPQSVAGVLTGARESESWQGKAQPTSWSDAIAMARTVVETVGAKVDVRAADMAPWHPGRGAGIYADGLLVGFAGEIHPRVLKAVDLPPRTSAFEIDLDLLGNSRARVAPLFSTQPPAIQDVALIVANSIPAADLISALKRGGGSELESVELFDRYEGEPIPAGSISLAFTLTFRAADRTLTGEEVAVLRASAVNEARESCGATLRG
jgi:phenylalanyl-tRNA synthetase beta chain